MTYDQWMAETAQIVGAYARTHEGQPAACLDAAHVLYRRAYEQARFPTLASALAEWGSVPDPPGPSPGPTDARIGASYYASLTDPRVDPAAFATRLQDAGCGTTRVWLIDAWAVSAAGGIGCYDGFMPWERSSGVFDLELVSTRYLDRSYTYVEAMNAHGIVPQLSGLELYSWSHRKAGLPWVPDANRGPFRNNQQGIRYGLGPGSHPDDEAFAQIATGGAHRFLEQFYVAIVAMLGGLRYTVELANEMPEKPMHYRLRDAWRRAGYTGPISVNRQNDTPGQYANMKIGQDFERIAFHGKRDVNYLTDPYPDEPRFATFETFYRSTTHDPSRIVLSSDGSRKSTDVDDAYDYDALGRVFRDALARDFGMEHQSRIKLRGFAEGRIDLNDLEIEWLRGLQP